MVSFCDIPLSQIRNHVATYGRYAIGLTKDWARSHGVTPVIYHHRDSQTALAAERLVISAASLITKHDVDLQGPLDALYLSFFFKPYEGRIWRNGRFSPHLVRFYDEREWRYVPLIWPFDSVAPPFLHKEFLLDSVRLQTANDRLRDINSLVFEPRFIRYIIINRDSEILETLEQVLQIKQHFSPNDLKLLTTRIISLEQILQDF